MKYEKLYTAHVRYYGIGYPKNRKFPTFHQQDIKSTIPEVKSCVPVLLFSHSESNPIDKHMVKTHTKAGR